MIEIDIYETEKLGVGAAQTLVNYLAIQEMPSLPEWQRTYYLSAWRSIFIEITHLDPDQYLLACYSPTSLLVST